MPKTNKEEKLKIEDIKKNPEIEKKHFIHRFIEHEHEIMICTTAFFMVLICLVVFIGFKTVDYSDKVDLYYDGNLKIKYRKDLSGISDIVSLSKDNIVDLRSGEKAVFNYTINNDSLVKTKFAVYLETDEEMIKLDNCSEKLVNVDSIRYSINNSKVKKLKKESDEGYIIHTGNIKSNNSKDYEMKVWIDKDSMENYNNYHFHGRIIIVDED